MKASEIEKIIRMAIRNPKKMPSLYIWGGPGIGKSSVVKQSAEAEGVDCIDIRLLLLDPTDLRGIPVPEDGNAKWLTPAFLPKDGKGVIFLDELNVAVELTQNSALQLVLDRKLGEYVLPEGWYIVAAGNREMEGFVRKMSPALLNRFIHLDFDIDLDEWISWAIRKNIDPRIIAFISKFRPELLYKFDPQRRSFPTPRSWEFTSKIIKNCDGVSDEIRRELIKGSVGEGASIEFAAYLDLWKELPNLDNILNGEDIIPETIELKCACCVGLASKAKEAKHYGRLIRYALKLEREFGYFLIRLLYIKDKDKLIVDNSEQWQTWANTIGKEGLLK